MSDPAVAETRAMTGTQANHRCLERNMYFGEPYYIDMSAITLVADGDGLLIDDVDKNSSVATAGCTAVTFWWRSTVAQRAEFTLDQIRTMFMQDGKKYLLSLKREGNVLQINLKLKR